MRTVTRIFPAVLAILATSGWCELCPPGGDACGGMRDTMLVYLGEEDWTANEFRPYVAYLDRAQGGRPTDWFYDSFLFLMYGGAPSNGSYFDGSANASDWRYYLDRLFAPQSGLGGLEACVERVSQELGEPAPVLPVTLMIPYLSTANRTFGDLDGDGADEDTQTDGGRVRAFAWLVDECLRRWDVTGYRHLGLWGFYWMMEGVGGPDMGVVQATAGVVHDRGKGFSWIPWFQAPGFERWREAGFDYAIVQPNYAFMPVPQGMQVPDQDRLSQNAADARRLGLGVEMEMHRPDTVPAHRLNLQLYLNHGVDEIDGTMAGAVRAYYQSGDMIARLYESPLESCRRLYDDLYRFHKGTYERRPVSLCEGCQVTVNGTAAAALTDGLWCAREGQEGRVAALDLPAVLEVDLGAVHTVGELRVHLATDGGDPGLPEGLWVETSEDGEGFELAAEMDLPQLRATGTVERGFAMAAFPPRSARLLRLHLEGAPGSRAGVDEILMYPCPNPLAEAASGLAGEDGTVRGPAPEPLADGRVDGRGLAVGEGAWRVGYELDGERCVAAVRGHARWPIGGESPRLRVWADGEVSTAADGWVTADGEGEGWAEAVVTDGRPGRLLFELAGPEGAVWDELELRPARNLAAGRPYTVTPGFGAHYPDDGGRELTDGQTCEEGFSDGRTVGWVSQPVTISVDLGEVRVVEGVRVHVQGGGYAWVHEPARVGLAASPDGRSWRRVRDARLERELVSSREVAGEREELLWQVLTFTPRTARYVRLEFPAGAWLMVSEIEVLSEGQNVARGASYRALPAPTSEAKYPDDGCKLTDGEWTPAGGVWSKCAGWHQGTPAVTVDLGETERVGLVRVHCLGGGPAGVWFPAGAWVSTSADGAEWGNETPLSAWPSESGTKAVAAFVEAVLPGDEVRYVRVRAERRGWLMVDEVEVYR